MPSEAEEAKIVEKIRNSWREKPPTTARVKKVLHTHGIQPLKRAGAAALKGAGVYGGFYITKKLLDATQRRHNKYIPDIKSDVELTPSYSIDNTVDSLVYSLGPIGTVAALLVLKNILQKLIASSNQGGYAQIAMQTPTAEYVPIYSQCARALESGDILQSTHAITYALQQIDMSERTLYDVYQYLDAASTKARMPAIKKVLGLWLGLTGARLLAKRVVDNKPMPPVTALVPQSMNGQFPVAYAVHHFLGMFKRGARVADATLDVANGIAQVGGTKKRGIIGRTIHGADRLSTAVNPLFTPFLPGQIIHEQQATNEMNKWDGKSPPKAAWNTAQKYGLGSAGIGLAKSAWKLSGKLAVPLFVGQAAEDIYAKHKADQQMNAWQAAHPELQNQGRRKPSTNEPSTDIPRIRRRPHSPYGISIKRVFRYGVPEDVIKHGEEAAHTVEKAANMLRKKHTAASRRISSGIVNMFSPVHKLMADTPAFKGRRAEEFRNNVLTAHAEALANRGNSLRKDIAAVTRDAYKKGIGRGRKDNEIIPEKIEQEVTKRLRQKTAEIKSGAYKRGKEVGSRRTHTPSRPNAPVTINNRMRVPMALGAGAGAIGSFEAGKSLGKSQERDRVHKLISDDDLQTKHGVSL